MQSNRVSIDIEIRWNGEIKISSILYWVIIQVSSLYHQIDCKASVSTDMLFVSRSLPNKSSFKITDSTHTRMFILQNYISFFLANGTTNRIYVRMQVILLAAVNHRLNYYTEIWANFIDPIRYFHPYSMQSIDFSSKTNRYVHTLLIKYMRTIRNWIRMLDVIMIDIE